MCMRFENYKIKINKCIFLMKNRGVRMMGKSACITMVITEMSAQNALYYNNI